MEYHAMRLVFIMLLSAFLANCGGDWVDDSKNFERIFGFHKPKDVKVLHSEFWKSAHWTVEYRYFIALRAPHRFVAGLPSEKVMKATAPESPVGSCGDRRPAWFLPKSMTNYDAWIPKTLAAYRVFLDRDEGTLFVCDERL
jgi:hypothetical protein